MDYNPKKKVVSPVNRHLANHRGHASRYLIFQGRTFVIILLNFAGNGDLCFSPSSPSHLMWAN